MGSITVFYVVWDISHDLRAIYPESGLDMETLPRKELYESLAKNLILPLSLLVLAGCGLSINHPASFDPSPGTTAAVNSAVPIEAMLEGMNGTSEMRAFNYMPWAQPERLLPRRRF
jgi:hypothetical protein